jgi:hypothetical protein
MSATLYWPSSTSIYGMFCALVLSDRSPKLSAPSLIMQSCNKSAYCARIGST